MIMLEKYRIIDLSEKLVPGISKVNGEYKHGETCRKIELREFIYGPDKTLMHFIDTESHVGTHVELPAHYLRGGRSASEMPVTSFIGEAIVLNFSMIRPEKGMGKPIQPTNLGKVEKEDIVLMWSHYKGLDRPYISPESAKFLARLNPKMIGVQNVSVEAPGGSMETHENLLKKNVSIIEGLVNLEKIRKERVFYIGLPLKIYGLDSSCIRAIVLEEKN